MKGIKAAKAATKTTVVPDRMDAIRAAFAQAKKGDTVLLAGLGHQNSRNMGGTEIPWDDRQVAKDLLAHIEYI